MQYATSLLMEKGGGGVMTIQDALNAKGIALQPAGPGEHVPMIENTAKQIKQRTHAHINVLPFVLASTLLVWLVSFCVSRINMLPSSVSGNRISPREMFTGRKVDYSRDLRVGFGDYVQIHEPNIIENSQVARTEGAIALLPVGNANGLVKFFKLSTCSVVTRDKFTLLPMPDTVITNLKSYAGKQRRTVQPDPSVTYRGRAIVAADDDTDTVDGDKEPVHIVPADNPPPDDPDGPDQPLRLTRYQLGRHRALDDMAAAANDSSKRSSGHHCS
jgi:hypothetical protein